MSTRSFLAAAVSLAGAGCALPAAPAVDAVQRFPVTLCVINPGAEPLVLHRVAVKLGRAGSPMATGFDEASIVLAPLSATRVPLALLARDVGSLGLAARIDYRVDGLVALVRPAALNVAYARTGQIDRTSLAPNAMPSGCAGSDLAVPL